MRALPCRPARVPPESAAFPRANYAPSAATSGTVTLYNSTLSTFNTTGSPLSIGYPGSQTQWNANDTQVLRITVTLADDNNANGQASGSKWLCGVAYVSFEEFVDRLADQT